MREIGMGRGRRSRLLLATGLAPVSCVAHGADLLDGVMTRASLRSLGDLEGRTVGVGQGSVYEQQARAVAGVWIRSYPAAAENLQDLAFGRIDAVLNDSLMVAYLLKNCSLPLRAGPRVGPVERTAVAFKGGNPRFKAAVDRVLETARASGELRRLSLKWFGVDASVAAR